MTIQLDDLMKGLEKEGKVVSASPPARTRKAAEPVEPVTWEAKYDASDFSDLWRTLGFTVYVTVSLVFTLVSRILGALKRRTS